MVEDMIKEACTASDVLLSNKSLTCVSGTWSLIFIAARAWDQGAVLEKKGTA